MCWLTMFANSFAKGQIPSDIVAVVRLGRMTALRVIISGDNIGKAICAEGRRHIAFSS